MLVIKWNNENFTKINIQLRGAGLINAKAHFLKFRWVDFGLCRAFGGVVWFAVF